MADDTKVPEGAAAIVVSHPPSGSQRILLKGKDGKFVRKNKPLPDTKEVVRTMRNFLNRSAEVGPDGKLTKDSKSRLHKMWDTMYRIATTESDDPKDKMAAVQAFKEMSTQAFGQPGKRKMDDEGEDGPKGIQFVVIATPDLPNAKPLNYEEHSRVPSRPSFLEAEEIVTNPAHSQDSDATKDSEPK